MNDTVPTITAEGEQAVTHTIGLELVNPEQSAARVAIVSRIDGGVPAVWGDDTAYRDYEPHLVLTELLDDIQQSRGVAEILPPSPEVIAALWNSNLPVAYTAPLDLRADQIDVPVDGPAWQVLDARDEETWRDVTNVVECEEEHPDEDDIDECVVLVSDAYIEGDAHLPVDATVRVRVPAAVTA